MAQEVTAGNVAAVQKTLEKEVLAALQRAVDRTNAQVSRAESIRKFSIISGDFTQENGLLTPTLKLKRDKVAEQFAAEIKQLYERH